MRQISTATTANQSIATAYNAATYTADADRWLIFRLFADQVAGNGSYTAYITIQRLGAGSFYEVQPRTTATVASGVTAIAFVTMPFPVKNTDVIKVYILGLAGDTTTPDITVGIWEDDSLRPTTAGNTLDVSSGGEAGLDWANIGSPTTSVGLSGTTVGTVTTTTTATTATNVTTVNGLASGVITATSIAADAITAAKIADGAIDAATFAAGAINAAAIAADAITDAKVASDVTIASVTGAVGSVTGAVGSVTGNVGGNVVGSVGSVTTVSDKTGYRLSSTGVQDIWDALTSALTTANSIGKLIVDNLNATISSVYSRIGAPVGASISADIAAVQSDTDNIQTRLPAALSGGKMDSTISGATVTAISDAVISGITLDGIAADVWAYTDGGGRTLTSVTPGASLVATITGTALSMTRAVSYDTTITGLTIPSNWAKIYFTAKTSAGDTDAHSQIQIVITNPGDAGDGLLYINGGTASSAADGTLTVDRVGGNIGISMTDDGTLLLSSGSGLTYDIKMITSASTSQVLTTGSLSIGVTPTLSVS